MLSVSFIKLTGKLEYTSGTNIIKKVNNQSYATAIRAETKNNREYDNKIRRSTSNSRLCHVHALRLTFSLLI